MMQADMLWNRIGTYSDDVLEHNWNEVSDLDAYSDDKKKYLNYECDDKFSYRFEQEVFVFLN